MTEEHLQLLQNPAVSLQLYGHVLDQETDSPLRYDPFAITHHLQETIVGYVSDPPVGEDGKTNWLVVLKYRQGGASTTAALSFYAKAQYNEGWEHLTLADNKDRANYLFERVMFNHSRWPSELRMPQPAHGELRQLTWDHGGKMRVGAAGTRGVGVGRGTSSMHASELPLWPNAGRQFSQISPSMVNRERSMMLLESTPFPMDEPSSDWFQTVCQTAAQGGGRYKYAFFPFWDGKLNVREWPRNSSVTTEEQRLLDKYHEHGLRLEHLAFRRAMLNTDVEFTRNPDLFGVYYPFDDVTCWQQSKKAVIRWEHIECAIKGELHPWPPGVEYKEYSPPRDGAIYVIGADPSGYGHDHASFHVFEIWDRDWRQVAVFSSDAEPPDVVDKVFNVGMRYNQALVAVERNGAGIGLTTGLIMRNYPNVFMDSNLKPGIHKHSEDYMVGITIDALRKNLNLRDKDTVNQLKTYRADRAIQPTQKQGLLDREVPGRRTRHHWDKVSALMITCEAARRVPQREAPPEVDPKVVVPLPGLTIDQVNRMAAVQRAARMERMAGRRRTRYKRRRRGR